MGSAECSAYVHYQCYLKDRSGDVLSGYNDAAQAFGLPPLDETALRQAEGAIPSKGGSTLLAIREPGSAVLHRYDDAYILQLIANLKPGASIDACVESWKPIYAQPPAVLHTSHLFIMPCQDPSGQAGASLGKLGAWLEPFGIPLSAVPEEVTLPYGRLSRIALRHYLFIVQQRLQDEAHKRLGEFASSFLPRLELFDAKVEHYAVLLSGEIERLRRAAQLDRFSPGHIWALRTAQPSRIKRFLQDFDASLGFPGLHMVRTDVSTMIDNIHKACENYAGELTRWEARFQLGNSSLFAGQSARQRVALANARHLYDGLLRELGEIEDGVRNLRARIHPVPSPSFEKVSEGEIAAYFGEDRWLSEQFLRARQTWNVWHFVKVPEMVLHERTHADNVFSICMGLLKALLQVGFKLTPVEFYLLACAVYLHDIGLSGGLLKARDTGTKRTFILDPDGGAVFPLRDYRNVRKLHGWLSYERLVRNETAYWLPYGAGRAVGKLVAYHQSWAPLPGMCCDPQKLDLGGEVLTFACQPLDEQFYVEIQGEGRPRAESVRSATLAAILRLVDAMDINQSRTGGDQYRTALREELHLVIQAELHALSQHLDLGSLPLERVTRIWEEGNPEEVVATLEAFQKSSSGMDGVVRDRFQYLIYLCKQPLHFRKHEQFAGISFNTEYTAPKPVLVATLHQAHDAPPLPALLELAREDIEGEFNRIRHLPPFSEFSNIRVTTAPARHSSMKGR